MSNTRKDLATRFNADTGRAAINKRWLEEKQSRERALIEFAERELGREVSLSDAQNYVILEPQFIKSRNGVTPAAKFLGQLYGLTIPPAPITVENSNVLVIAGNAAYTFDDIDLYAREAPEMLEADLQNADWSGAEELRSYALEKLDAKNR